jgi:uncharacterized protein with GYD domain
MRVSRTLPITEAPTDELGAAFTLKIGAMGNVRSTSMRAYSREEFAEIVASIP